MSRNTGSRPPKPSEQAKSKGKHLVQKDELFRGVLSRNRTYRPDARTMMKAIGVYDNEGQIKKGVEKQDSVRLAVGDVKQKLINERIPKYKFEYVNKTRTGGSFKNFTTETRPYNNQAHHILVCELFYDQHGWDSNTLAIVKESTYNINNELNILYLPHTSSKKIPQSCHYHNLPNHAKGHDKYNRSVLSKVNKILKLSKKALKAKDKCEDDQKMDLLDQLYTKLTDIEDEYYELIIGRGANPLA